MVRLLTLSSIIAGCGGNLHDGVGDNDFSSLGLELYLGDPALYSASQNIFSNRCAACHNFTTPATPKFGNILDTEQLVATGMIIPGDSAASPIFQEVDSGRMPQGGMLTPTDIQTIRDWIDSMGFIAN